MKKFDYSLSISDTLLVKGIAICFIVGTHLFPDYASDVYQRMGLGKVGVALFLFLSAYGLTIQFNSIQFNSIQFNSITMIDTLKFQMKRFVKFYANYWVIFLIFVPIGVFVFGRELGVPYGGGRGLEKLFTDFLGINGLQSYNITWWFNQLIIYLYLLFPLLYFAVKKVPIPVLIFGLMLWKVDFPIVMSEAHFWILHFMLGIFAALNINKISDFLNRFNRYLIFGSVLFIFLGMSMIKIFSGVPYLSGIYADAFLAPVMIVLLIMILRNTLYINILFQQLGKHSMNIFMIHTFIYMYFFHDFIYSFKYPILIFLVLLITSLFASYLIELLKKMIRLTELSSYIQKRIDRVC